MKIVIAGGSGFLGRALVGFYKDEEVLVLTRSPKRKNEIYWDSKSLGAWVEKLEGCDVLINLTGKSVDCRYTQKNKDEILLSRIDSTQVLQKAVASLTTPPKVWLNASSATIYTHAETILMDEYTGLIGDDFSMGICKAWEAGFFKDDFENVRKVALRTSIVMGKKGGAFPKLKMVSRLGLGGKQGRGNQFLSWIHINDFCAAVDFVIKNESLYGVINVTSPTPLRNADLMKKLRQKLGMPFGLPSSVALLEIVSWFLGTETELLLKSRNVSPKRLIENGFVFQYNSIEEALEELI